MFFSFLYLAASVCPDAETDVTAQFSVDATLSAGVSKCFKTGQNVIIRGNKVSITLHYNNESTGPKEGIGAFFPPSNEYILELSSTESQNITLFPNIESLEAGSVAFISSKESFYVNVLQKSAKGTSYESSFCLLGPKTGVSLSFSNNKESTATINIDKLTEYIALGSDKSRNYAKSYSLITGKGTAKSTDGHFLIKQTSSNTEEHSWPTTIHGYITVKQPEIFSTGDLSAAAEYEDIVPVWVIVIIIVASIIVVGIFVGSMVYFCIKKRGRKITSHVEGSEDEEEHVNDGVTNIDALESQRSNQPNETTLQGFPQSNYVSAAPAANPYSNE